MLPATPQQCYKQLLEMGAGRVKSTDHSCTNLPEYGNEDPVVQLVQPFHPIKLAFNPSEELDRCEQ